jgi:hypothetical protein
LGEGSTHGLSTLIFGRTFSLFTTICNHPLVERLKSVTNGCAAQHSRQNPTFRADFGSTFTQITKMSLSHGLRSEMYREQAFGLRASFLTLQLLEGRGSSNALSVKNTSTDPACGAT